MNNNTNKNWWFSKNGGNNAVDLSTVIGWSYKERDKTCVENYCNKSTLYLALKGSGLSLVGEDADEVFQLIKNKS